MKDSKKSSLGDGRVRSIFESRPFAVQSKKSVGSGAAEAEAGSNLHEVYLRQQRLAFSFGRLASPRENSIDSNPIQSNFKLAEPEVDLVAVSAAQRTRDPLQMTATESFGECVDPSGPAGKAAVAGAPARQVPTSNVFQLVTKDDYSGKERVKYGLIKALIINSRSGYSEEEADRILANVPCHEMNIIIGWDKSYIESLDWNIQALDILRDPSRFSNSHIQIGGRRKDLAGIRTFLDKYNLPLLKAFEDRVKLDFIDRGDHSYEATKQGAQALWADIRKSELFDQSGDTPNQWTWLETIKGYRPNSQKEEDPQSVQDPQNQGWADYYTELLSGYCAHLVALYRTDPNKVLQIVGDLEVDVAQEQLKNTLYTLFQAVHEPNFDPAGWPRVYQRTIAFDSRKTVESVLTGAFRKLALAQISSYFIELSTTVHGMGIEGHSDGSATVLEPNHHISAINCFAPAAHSEKAQLITDYIWETGLAYGREKIIKIEVLEPKGAEKLPDMVNIPILGADDLTSSVHALRNLNPSMNLTLKFPYGPPPEGYVSQKGEDVPQKEEAFKVETFTVENTDAEIAKKCKDFYDSWGATEMELLDIDVRSKQKGVQPISIGAALDDAIRLKKLWNTLDETQLAGRRAEIIAKAKEYNTDLGA